MSVLLFEKVEPIAYSPTGDGVGYDIRTPNEYVLPSRDKILVDTRLKFKFPEGTYGRLATKNDSAVLYSVETGGGVLDPDYEGVVQILLYNHGHYDVTIQRGQTIAQLILEKFVTVPLQEKKSIEYDRSVCECRRRGSQGFGSSGK